MTPKCKNENPKLPPEWEIKKLGEVCEVLDKFRKPITKKDRVAGKIPYYGATGLLDYVSACIFDEQLVLLGEDGAKWGTCESSAYIIEGKSWVNNHAHVLRPNRNLINDKWLVHNLNYQDLRPYISGMTVPKLNQANMLLIPIPLPPLPEQKRIVAILDEVFAAIGKAKENAEKNLANARELFESYLHNVFANPGKDWKKKRLWEVLDMPPQNGWSPPAANHSDTGTPVLTLSSVTGFCFRPDKVKFTSAVTDSSKKYWVHNGDLLITRSNTPELVGHVAIASEINRPTIYPDLIMRMTPTFDLATTDFLYFQMRAPALRAEIKGKAHGANPTMKKISNSDVKTLPIVIPPLAKQCTIVEVLKDLTAKTQNLESVYQQKVASLDELKKSILDKAFRGEL
ncbi:MAG: hypothetical protein A2020_11980 [Lentisphaerae bacterium GWF2_45_14]|nr:MAG: hypothetical protein A2020_11980 [Lentisphaerae bacterium GWF2_45_14]